MKKVLSIAGSDCSGGAGIQADLKTFAAHKLYGMSIITALTAQNTTGVTGIMEATADFVEKQMDAVFTDIFPDAVKIGMVSSVGIIEAIAKKLEQHRAVNIVADPVMIATSGSRLLSDDAVTALKTKLLPLADVITPNIPEAETLCRFRIHNAEDMVRAGQSIGESISGAVLIKGGHSLTNADDMLWHKGQVLWLHSPRVDNTNTHGTGCTLSSAIASNLAMGHTMEESIKRAKQYITGALEAGLNLGSGSGPLNHCYNL